MNNKELSNFTILDFTDRVASSSATPGGGSCAALCGSLAMALTSMTAALTRGKKYEEFEKNALEVEEQSRQIKAELLALMEKDAKVFNEVSAAFSLPKSTDEEKKKRSLVIQEGLKNCTKVPFEMMQLMDKALSLSTSMLDHSNPTCISDLGISFLFFKSAIEAAWLNVLINLNTIKDKDFTENYRKKGENILSHALPLAEEGYEKVLKQMEK